MNTKKFEELLKNKKIKKIELAKKLGITKQLLNYRINSLDKKNAFPLSEIKLISNFLDVELEIFF